MKIDYIRGSTYDQNLYLQLSVLNKTDCEKVYQKVISWAKAERPGISTNIFICQSRLGVIPT